MTPNCARISLCLLTSALATFAAEAPRTFPVSEFTFNRPAGWQWVETTSSMRKAQLKVTDDKTKQTAEVVFFYFGEGSGGGTQANVERWLGQFEEPREKIDAKVDKEEINGHTVTYVQAHGTYLSGMPGGVKTPLANHMLAGAIIESDKGNVFVRMTGPKGVVTTESPAFKKMISGALK